MNVKTFEEVRQRFLEITFEERFDLIVAVANGGIIPAAMLNQRLNLDMQLLKLHLRDADQKQLYDRPRLLEEIRFEVKGKKILLVEDDASLCRGISFKLKKEGYEVLTSPTVKDAIVIFENNKIDLVISDITLEDGDGYELCQKIRQNSDVLFIFLTALDQEVDMVTGYDLGADDYITKPFSLMVLISKVNALMRRTSLREESKRIIRCRNLSFYPEEMKLLINNEEVILSKNEYKLLNCLIKNSGQIVTKGQLLEALWDKDGAFVDENTVAVNIRRLREKIEDIPSEPVFIKNIRGIGYRWNEEIS